MAFMGFNETGQEMSTAPGTSDTSWEQGQQHAVPRLFRANAPPRLPNSFATITPAASPPPFEFHGDTILVSRCQNMESVILEARQTILFLEKQLNDYEAVAQTNHHLNIVVQELQNRVKDLEAENWLLSRKSMT